MIFPKTDMPGCRRRAARLELNGIKIEAGDGAALSESAVLEISGDGEILLFDLD